MTTTQNNTVHPHIHLQTYARGVVEKSKNVVAASSCPIDRPAMRLVRGTIMFWSFLHNRNRRKALKWHRKLKEAEQEGLDALVFDEVDRSEAVVIDGVACPVSQTQTTIRYADHVKNNCDNREVVLEVADTCSYWAHVPIQ